MKILGSGFVGTVSVAFGSVAATSFHVDSDSQISALVPAAATAGQVMITVKTKSASATASFTYTNA